MTSLSSKNIFLTFLQIFHLESRVSSIWSEKDQVNYWKIRDDLKKYLYLFVAFWSFPNSIIDFKARQFFNMYNKDVLANFGGSNSWSIGGDWERTRLRELLIRDLLLSEFMRFGTYCSCSLLWRATVCARNKRICWPLKSKMKVNLLM